MTLQAVTGQLYVVEGVVQEGTAVPGLLATTAPKRANRSRAKDFLFIHLTLSGKHEETSALSLDLLATINQTYFQSSGSVTAALRRALLNANEKLLRANMSQGGPSREGAITCAVLRNDELYMLQAGESLALLGHQFGVERLPANLPAHITPLGQSAGLDIRYFHQQLDMGNTLLLADPRIAHLPTETLQTGLIDVEVSTGLETLREVIGDDSARLLLIEFSDEAEMPTAVMPIPTINDAQPTVAIPRPQPLATPPQREQDSSSWETQPIRLPKLPLPDIDVETTARQATADAAFGLSRFTRWLAAVFARLRPVSAANDADENQISWLSLTVLATLIPIIVTIIVTGVYLRWSDVNEFADLKQDMSNSLVAAEESGDNVAAARAHYNTLLAQAAEAEALRPNDADVNRMRLEAFTALDRIDGVVRLSATSFYEYPEDVVLTAVSLRDGFNGGVDVLDSTNGRVLNHATSEDYTEISSDSPDPTELIFRGQAVQSHVVGTILDVLWRPRGLNVARDGVAMLDGSGALLTFFPNLSDIRTAPLGLASEWRTPLAAATFSERLYVLDPGSGEIWKYFPDGEGFRVDEIERTIAFTQDPGLDQAVDFDIYSENGSLIVVYKDGRLRYYDTRSSRIQWDETTLVNDGGLTTPLVAPTDVKIIGPGLNATIFVADPGSGRIIRISQGGTVLDQYRANDTTGFDPFSQMSDFAIAQTPLRIFVTVGNKIYLAQQQ
ncbi:MAG: hypothetical protein AAF614_38345 [Chloroflexota bacterium]